MHLRTDALSLQGPTLRMPGHIIWGLATQASSKAGRSTRAAPRVILNSSRELRCVALFSHSLATMQA